MVFQRKSAESAEGVWFSGVGSRFPGRMRPVDGFQLITRKPQEVVNENGEGALFPFTQEFQHPDEKTQATADAKSRWQQGGRRSPQLAYEAENLAWRGAEWRTLTAEERATLHGFPPEVAKPAQMSSSAPGRYVEAMANSAIGNGFHWPSMMLFMFLLLQGVVGEEQQMQSPYCGIGVAADEEDLRRRVAGTVFDEMTTPDQDKKAAIPWIKVASNLHGAEAHLLQLQLYWAYRVRAGWFGVALGPSWASREQPLAVRKVCTC